MHRCATPTPVGAAPDGRGSEGGGPRLGHGAIGGDTAANRQAFSPVVNRRKSRTVEAHSALERSRRGPPRTPSELLGRWISPEVRPISRGSLQGACPTSPAFARATRGPRAAGVLKGYTCDNVAPKKAWPARRPTKAGGSSHRRPSGGKKSCSVEKGIREGEYADKMSASQKQRAKWAVARARKEALSARDGASFPDEASWCYDEMKAMNKQKAGQTPLGGADALDSQLRRRSQSTPGWRSSPTWQVPLQTELIKANNSDVDDWKGMLKEKLNADFAGMKQSKLEADEINKTYGKMWDCELDDYGKHVTSHLTPIGANPKHQEETDAWANSLKQRRRARTLGPSERLISLERTREREPSLDRGVLRGSRRTLPMSNDSRVRGSSPFSAAGERERSIGDRTFSDRFLERGFSDRFTEHSCWERNEDRTTSRLRGRSEDSFAFTKRSVDDSYTFAKALSHVSQELERQQRPHRAPYHFSGATYEPPEGRSSDIFERRKLPTWHVPDVDAETPVGTIVGEREAISEDFESDCKAVPEDLETDTAKATNRAPSVDSLRGGDSRRMKLWREVRALLNKISPENEAPIVSQMSALHIEDAEDVKTVARATVEKAMSDPFYAEIYARAISKLALDSQISCGALGHCSSDSDSSKSEGGIGPWSFRGAPSHCIFTDAVLNHCERTFDKFFCKPETLGESSTSEDVSNRRNRATAFIRLLGELYKVGILRTGPLQQCIDKLLLARQDRQKFPTHWPPKAWIECSCELLTICGKDLMRNTPGKSILKTSAERLERWKDFRSYDVPGSGGDMVQVYPARIQFMIQDVVEAYGKGFPSCDAKGAAKARCKMPMR